MLDIGWWELFVIGMVALLVVGPKELPTLLRTIGRYVGMIKRQADEFRSQFDQAMRENEFNELRTEIESVKSDLNASITAADDTIAKDPAKPTLDDAWDEDLIEPEPHSASTGAPSSTVPDHGVSGAAETKPAVAAASAPMQTEPAPVAASIAAPVAAPIAANDTNRSAVAEGAATDAQPTITKSTGGREAVS